MKKPKKTTKLDSEKFWRHPEAIVREIVYQILYAELAFNICNDFPKIPGKGNDILPYYYNLNFCKGLITLHSLLLSKYDDEITIKNYINQYEWEYKTQINTGFKNKIKNLGKRFLKIYRQSLRNKIAAHISYEFNHIDFANSYIMPTSLNTLLNLCADLKATFFKFSGYSEVDDPFFKIRAQSKKILTI